MVILNAALFVGFLAAFFGAVFFAADFFNVALFVGFLTNFFAALFFTLAFFAVPLLFDHHAASDFSSSVTGNASFARSSRCSAPGAIDIGMGSASIRISMLSGFASSSVMGP